MNLFKTYLGFLTGLLMMIPAKEMLAQAPAPYTVQDGNTIYTVTATSPQMNPTILNTLPLRDAKVTTQYIDGLGRPFELVQKKASLITDPASPLSSTAAVDLVTARTYDVYGREVYSFLPFAANNTNGNTSISDGNFKKNPFEQQATFSQGEYPGETFFYGKTNFELSPLSRATEVYAPGNSWVGTESTTKKNITSRYLVNTATDAVRYWTVTIAAVGGLSTYATTTTYPPGTLFKTIQINEHGKQVIEFKDKEGKVVLKKVQLTASDAGTGSAHTGWLNTYYIYDDFKMLRCVIQPKGVELISANWVLTDATILAEQCFRYEYDAKRRQIIKKIPGAGAQYLVYDSRDRLVLRQDAILGSGKWEYFQYDSRNRPIATGIWTTATTFAAHITATALIPNGTAGNYPAAGTSGLEELSSTFYDNYDFLTATAYSGHGLNAGFFTGDNSYFSAASNTAWPYPQAVTSTTATQGMVTGGRVKVLGTTTWLYTATYYDKQGRTIQVQSKNLSGGLDVTTTQYTFNNQPLITVQRQVIAGAGAQTTILLTKLTYDDLNRLVKAEKAISNTTVNSGAMTSYKTILEVAYDALGQIKSKKIGTKPAGSTPLETQNSTYNIRGWLLGVNRDFTNPSAPSTPGSGNWFGFDLGYDKLANASTRNYLGQQLNGNISGIVWRSVGDGVPRKYDFSYDPLSRLLTAGFEQRNSDGAWNNSLVNYTVKMGSTGADPATAYDANGNILRMQQWGLKLNASSQLDDLSYTYIPNTNRIQAVTDAFNDNTSTLGDFKYNASTKTTTDYTYDGNGNLTIDKNKGITSAISYNHLNLPAAIPVSGKGMIAYTYDASGNKWKKSVTEGSTITNTYYIGGAVYEQKGTGPLVLQFMGHEEGRIRNTIPTGGTTLVYDYFLKDHLGNVRMILTEEVKRINYPIASMENVTDKNNLADPNNYIPYYSNTDYTVTPSVRELKSNTSNPPANGTTNPNNYWTKLSSVAGDRKVGPGILLKVMAGDKIELRCDMWWRGSATGATQQSPLADILSILATTITSGPGAGKITLPQTGTNGSFFNPAVTGFMSNNNPAQTTKPKAYLNWIFLNEQFAYSSTNGSGAEPLGAADTYKTYTRLDANGNAIPVLQSGYVYIYTSNESNIAAFFDNLAVNHIQGALIEETHYYPFGLTMAGISTGAIKGAAYPENKLKFNGIEHTNDFDLNQYDAFYRNYDPQLGRWRQIDPKAIEGESPYAAMKNGPVFNTDFLGDTTVYYNISNGTVLGTVNNAGAMQNVRVDALAYIAAQGAALAGGYDLSKQENANQFVSAFNNVLSTVDSKLGTNLISFATGETRLEFTGQANAANPAEGNGNLNVNQMFDDGGHLTLASYQAIGGPWGNGSPENGAYTADNLQNRGPGSGNPNPGMTRDGVGFSLNLNPLFSTNRSLLRIHPDGGEFVGTQGCIGIQENATRLLQFKSTMHQYLQTHDNIRVNINILNNPNNNGRGRRVVGNRE
ncbi:RHS repeat-associated core domain-containing protein [Chitinophaga ginsengisegetis]|uniref:RHS repeat-associated core domain-containing protein n=1 Tax=Chitinophaga ginsengisegetis TaxID=393003 RepID=A0A1T5PD53_9BACT|nr:DUF6443 domain-containing protein [Chitinophaga ginsengisegetis]SKD10489.1 RHS repeat-associated core domain-containing protein [Chitinophaga ginsengisegetis]